MSKFELENELYEALKKTQNKGGEDDQPTTTFAEENDDAEYEDDEEYDDEDFGEEEYEEEVVEISENEMLALLDQQQDPFEVCQQIFDKEKLFEANPEQVLIEPNVTVQHFRDLYNNGYVVVDNFIPFEQAQEIHDLAKKLSHTFKPACEMKMSYEDEAEDTFRDNTARSDVIRWLHPKDFTSELTDESKKTSLSCCCTDSSEDIIQWKGNETLRGVVLNKFKVIQKKINEFAPCVKYDDAKMELMWSLYKSHGTYYEKHRDSFPSNGKDEGPLDQRKVTALLYMNTEWKDESDGGQLKIFIKPENASKHTERTTKLINPTAGRLVLFLSGALDHEVMASFKDRVALTSWLS
ncbi:predicted protein [Naegleria gruberi]|uniref:Predicted protein n=1 Tax=Naegleria gruberi TaxID=5762 RepID=D2VUL5_NAEGR|nr:uncharacterized protein NAEGRDRAFT_52382 [Naegleria gruberi]EFC39473.1 predicted protein [Naegleria gruberi]|eukprot:XP_002672217.1 predicted protein [Naegleria gruberi strain NEG-M]